MNTIESKVQKQAAKIKNKYSVKKSGQLKLKKHSSCMSEI